MKRALLLFAFICLSITSIASHISGGQITWSALGNDQYTFSLHLIRNTTGAVLGTTLNLQSNVPGFATIPVTYSTSYPLSGICSSNGRPYEVVTFVSSTVTIPQAQPGSPWQFTFTQCCMPGITTNNVSNVATVGFHLDSRMYVKGRNKSTVRFLPFRPFIHTYSKRVDLAPQYLGPDSAYYTMARPYIDASNVVLQNGGYSFQKPTSPQDTLLQTGVFYAGSQDSVFGAYLSFHGATYEGNFIANRVQFSTLYTYEGADSNATNPNVTLLNSSVPYTFIDNSILKVSVGWGQQLSLDFHAQDHDTLADGTYNTIQGSLLVPQFPNVSSFPFLLPLAPSQSIVDTGDLYVNLNWTIPSGFAVGEYPFDLQFIDNNCPYNGMQTIRIILDVKEVWYAEYSTCTGDSVTIPVPFSGSQVQWYPSKGLSNDTLLQPKICPDSTTVYNVVVDGDTVAEYTVHIDYPITPAYNVLSDYSIDITNASQLRSTELNYFYYPIDQGKSLYPTNHSGYYQLKSTNGMCSSSADSILIQSDSLVSSVMYTSFIDPSEKFRFYPGDNWVVNVDFSQNGAPSVLDEIIIPGLRVAPLGGDIKLTYRSPTGFPYTVFGTPINDDFVKFELNGDPILGRSMEFTFWVTDGYYDVPSILATDSISISNSLGTITSIEYNETNTPRYDVIVPIVFRGATSITVEEQELEDVSIYPQPANSSIKIEGLEKEATYALINPTGIEVKSGHIDPSNEIQVSELPSGMYVLTLRTAGETRTMKVIIAH